MRMLTVLLSGAACYWESDSVLVTVLGASSSLQVGAGVTTATNFGASQATLAAPATPSAPVIYIVVWILHLCFPASNLL